MDYWVVGETDRIIHSASDHFMHKVPGTYSDTMVGQNSPELWEVGDPRMQRVMPVADQPTPFVKTGTLVYFQIVRVPSELISRPSCEKHVIGELRPDGQFGESTRVAQSLQEMVGHSVCR